MYQYTEFDRQFLRSRAAQYRDQLQRNLQGSLSDDEFRPLRLQNGWYLQRHAPMLRVAIPYGELAARQLRALATIARNFDRSYCHFTTRQNLQFNWIALDKSADVMDLLADVDMHGIQTSGNCIRNITSDERAGIAPDEIADPRPFCEILRQWSTLHPEFAFLPRKFKLAVTGAHEDRAATAWHDVGLHVLRNEEGEIGFRVLVGGGMGRTPIIAGTLREFLPWNQILNYLEAVVRVYNRWGRRDNMYKARIKILFKAQGEAFRNEVESEYQEILALDGAPHTITQAELERVSASFTPPLRTPATASDPAAVEQRLRALAAAEPEFGRWLQQNVAAHKDPALRAVTLSLKRLGYAPGDASADQMDQAADLADTFSAGELRVTHDQNLLLPWVRAEQLPELWRAATQAGLARANIRLLTDMIACPGGDFCALANARSIPIAQAISERYQDMDELFDLGEIDLHISGCINSCGHHHSGHIGILGVDKDGKEWYQVSLGGSDGSTLSGAAVPGKVVGPSFGAIEVPGVIEAVLDTYRLQRNPGETFIDTLRRVGHEPFRQAANGARLEQPDDQTHLLQHNPGFARDAQEA
ncbi:MAG: nitrite/sulfite reductase [Burkholderiales bacterium]|nr:nitrite/sulfite reductase [Burkholderiales bacterium]